MYEIGYNPIFVPVRSSRASVRTVVEGKKISHLMHVQRTGQYWDLDSAANLVWKLIDAKRTVHQIAQEAQLKEKIGEEEVTGSLLFFAENELLVSARDLVEKKRIRVLSSFVTSVTLAWNATRIFGMIHRIIRPFLRRDMFWLTTIIIFLGIVLYSPRFNSTFNDARNFQILGSTVVGFLFYNFVVLAPVIIIHESSHGLALVHYSGRAGEVGTGLFYFGPMFYVDIAEYWSLPRRERMMIMWAGNLSTLLIGSIIVLFRLVVSVPASTGTLLDLTAFWCFYITLWNLAPPFETDGYHILADLVRMPTLRQDSYSYLKTRILRILHRPVEESESFPREKRLVLLAYAVFSVVFVGYIVYSSLRFTLFMAGDAEYWTTQITTGIFSRTLSTVGVVIGLTTIIYFALSVSGYLVLAKNQFQKSMVRGLRFDTLHDRDLAVYFHIPSQVSPHAKKDFERKTEKIAKSITPNFSLGHKGGLFYTNLRIGPTSLPISQMKTHLTRIENRFYRAYDNLIVSEGLSSTDYPRPDAATGRVVTEMLEGMAGKTQPGEKGQALDALREFLRRQEAAVRYFLLSTFATAWTIEVPPAEQQEILNSLLPSLLVDDLTNTNLVGDLEEFKKSTIYGLDSIAKLAEEGYAERQEALVHPDKLQVVASFEPVRGRIIFVGRTERIENKLASLGVLFHAKVWSGYFDNALADTTLRLNTILQSLPNIIPDLASFRDGEVRVLNQYLGWLVQQHRSIQRALIRLQACVRPCKESIRHLKGVLEPRGTKIGLFESVLSVNQENLESIPFGIREVEDLNRIIFPKLESLKELVSGELRKREAVYLAKKRRLVKNYVTLSPLSAVLAASGLFLLGTWIGPFLLGASLATQLFLGGSYYLLWRSSRRVPHYPAVSFATIVSPLYALAQTWILLTKGASLMDLEETIDAGREKKDERGPPSPLVEKPQAAPPSSVY